MTRRALRQEMDPSKLLEGPARPRQTKRAPLETFWAEKIERKRNESDESVPRNGVCWYCLAGGLEAERLKETNLWQERERGEQTSLIGLEFYLLFFFPYSGVLPVSVGEGCSCRSHQNKWRLMQGGSHPQVTGRKSGAERS